ncbi:efflux RND transporter periplasmic adaptor subunit [Allohahella marinimesophila]|uniref:Multidrug efflux RND transporter periplasmic adaptor subunit MuxA n=1 Tax=Allohahella marinimesophila TaxID=1054972 RepID=A0ABP7P3S3_9GAMM
MDDVRRGSGSWRWLLPVLIAGLAAAAAWYQLNRASTVGEMPLRNPNKISSVRVAPAEQGRLDIQVSAIGTVTPLNTVVVRSRVDGILDEILFEEGREVVRGQLLARIEPDVYESRLQQALGQFQQNQAQLENARANLRLYQDLLRKNAIPKQQFDSQTAVLRELEAAAKSLQAQVDDARLQRSWTDIRAPISGRLGLRQIDAGNLISASAADGLVTIAQTSPIAVVFSIPETELLGLRQALLGQDTLPVEALDRQAQDVLAVGRILALDNQIDAATGTLKVKAAFDNEYESLFPNQFVNVRVGLGSTEETLIIPADAVQYGARGSYVYVVEEGRAFLRDIVAGEQVEGRLAVVSGLVEGDLVVTDGLDRLRDGREVSVDG